MVEQAIQIYKNNEKKIIKIMDIKAGNYIVVSKKFLEPKPVPSKFADKDGSPKTNYLWGVDYNGEYVAMFLNDYTSNAFSEVGAVGEPIKIICGTKETKEGKIYKHFSFEKQ